MQFSFPPHFNYLSHSNKHLLACKQFICVNSLTFIKDCVKMPLSYGYIETLGFIAAVEAADAMLKTAKIKLVAKKEIGYGLVTVIIEGELGAVQSAVTAGSAAAEKVGQLISSNVIPRPYTDAGFFFSFPANEEMTACGILPPSEETLPIENKKQQQKDKTKEKNINKIDPEDIIISALKKAQKEGATLKEISQILKMDQAATRVLLKELLDKEIVEKIQHKYYLI